MNYNQAFAEYAYNCGMDNREQAWILHPCDVWLSNPHYSGPEVPHPESYEPETFEFN